MSLDANTHSRGTFKNQRHFGDRVSIPDSPRESGLVSRGSQGLRSPLAWVQSLGWEEPLEEGMATHSGVLAWRIPGTGEPGGCRLWDRTELDTTDVT